MTIVTIDPDIFHFQLLVIIALVVFVFFIMACFFGQSFHSCDLRFGKGWIYCFICCPFLLTSTILFCLPCLPSPPTTVFIHLVYFLYFNLILGEPHVFLFHVFNLMHHYQLVAPILNALHVCSHAEVCQDYALIEFFNGVIQVFKPREPLINLVNGFNLLNMLVGYIVCLRFFFDSL